ncbi:MAG TPA: CvpA family protein [Terriglobales bacterium]|nr:CvpA family protein [Terriglobales bacterium]
MNVADWVILGVVLVSTAAAVAEGFFHQAFGIAGLVVGYLLAAWQYPRLSAWFGPHLTSPWVADIAGFVVIFVAVVVVAGIAGRIVRWAMKEAGLSLVDRLLGALLGLVKGSLFVAILLMGMTAFTPSSPWLEGSQLAPYFLVVGRAAIWLAPSQLRAKFFEGLDLVRHAHIPEAPALMPKAPR